MRRFVRALFPFFVALVACGALPRPGLGPADDNELFPPDTMHLTASDTYRRWWKRVEDCSGKTYPIDRVRWYVVKGDSYAGGFIDPNTGRPVWGLAYDRHNAIVLAFVKVTDSAIVMHEDAHLIASRKMHDPEIYQRGPCSQLVACWDLCNPDTLPKN